MKQLQNKRNFIKAGFQESLPEIPPKDPPVKEPLFLSRR